MGIAPDDTSTAWTPIDEYLARQSELTAVERFARRHEIGALPSTTGVYSELIPTSRPAPGQQYGFAVDLDACTGCKACVTACHSMNGLDDDESWRSVGLLHGCVDGLAVRQSVTTACHHCVDPACLNGCPVDAYEKDPITGIVAHLDDQCIGCGYCMLTCPYEVPRYSPSRGIVRKCDMCRGRLDAGEAPACVQACPNGAITIALVDKANIAAAALIGRLVPGAPRSSLTSPTTVYTTRRSTLRTAQPADRGSLRPAQAHPPLAVMLVLTQLSVGAFLTDLLTRFLAPAGLVEALRPYNAVVALVLGFVALGASVLHLGRPRLAYRAVIGIRHSWLSREILAFGVFSGLASIYALVLLLRPARAADAVPVLGLLVGAVGLIGVACSALIYVVTGRELWRMHRTSAKFILTSAACGLATVLLTSLAASSVLGEDTDRAAMADLTGQLALALVTATTLKLAVDASVLWHLRPPDTAEGRTDPGHIALAGTAFLLTGDLRTSSKWRFALGTLGGVVCPLVIAMIADVSGPGVLFALAALSAILVTAGEFVERDQFFRSVVVPRMPGDLA